MQLFPIIFLVNLICKRSINKMSEALNKVEDVDIDASGVFKYILIKVKDKDAAKMIVRGYARCDYHGKFMKIKIFLLIN